MHCDVLYTYTPYCSLPPPYHIGIRFPLLCDCLSKCLDSACILLLNAETFNFVQQCMSLERGHAASDACALGKFAITHTPAVRTVLSPLQQHSASRFCYHQIVENHVVVTYLGSVPILQPRCAALLVCWQTGDCRTGGQPPPGRLEMQCRMAVREGQLRRSRHAQQTPEHSSSLSFEYGRSLPLLGVDITCNTKCHGCSQHKRWRLKHMAHFLLTEMLTVKLLNV